MRNKRYSVHRMNGKITRLSLIEEGSTEFTASGYVTGEWKPMPG